MLENVCAHESPRSGRGIATSPTERELKRNQVVSRTVVHINHYLVACGSFWSILANPPHVRFWSDSRNAGSLMIAAEA